MPPSTKDTPPRGVQSGVEGLLAPLLRRLRRRRTSSACARSAMGFDFDLKRVFFPQEIAPNMARFLMFTSHAFGQIEGSRLGGTSPC